MITQDEQLRTLERANNTDYQLAWDHVPVIRFDAREPFLPLAVGYTVFRDAAESKSFPRQMWLPPGAAAVIEYAIWWDWDIQHLYELEHIWVYVDADGRRVGAEVSWHGEFRPAHDAASAPDGRLVVFSEPGKHAFASTPGPLLERRAHTGAVCGAHAGKQGLLVTPLFEGIIPRHDPLDDRLAHTYLLGRAFEPNFAFDQVFDLRNAILVAWPALRAWIPTRVAWWLAHLREAIPASARRFIRIAHRGASAYAQEGSALAIRRAAELGADMVEVDVRLTVDGVAVIAHDADLRRLWGVERAVHDVTAAELAALTPADREPILTLAALASLCRELGMGIYLDWKEIDQVAVEAAVGMLRASDMMPYTIFASFRPDWLADIRAAAPDAITSVLFSSTHIDPVLLARSAGCVYVHPCWERFDTPHLLLTEAWIERVRAAELGIICWHEERPAVIAGLQQLGVDGICSDQPDLLVLG